MRTISDASLAIINQDSGVEPVIVLQIFWNQPTSYCDRKFATEGLEGKLLDISGIEDILDITQSSTSVTLSATLDDSDGSIKQIYNQNDIHKTYVKVLQWFAGIPFSDAFLIFEGEISSPIIWSEGDRTLKFEIVTKLEDREVGFSVEEGTFDAVPSSLIGKAWPIVFGTVGGMKVLPLVESPSAILGSGFGIVNQEVWAEELEDLQSNLDRAYEEMIFAFQIGNSYLAQQFASTNNGADTDESLQYASAAASAFSQANQYGQEVVRLGQELAAKIADKELQESYEYRNLPIAQTNLPTGVPLTVAIDNFTASATVVGNTIQLSNVAEIEKINEKVGTNAYLLDTGKVDEYRRDNKGQKFTWIDGGTRIKIANYPMYYIASVGEVVVLNVWAQNQYGRSVVPREWYRTDTATYNSLTVTRLIFDTPLTSRPGDWQDGDMEIDCTSVSVGSNVVDIMRWVIDNFTTLQVDVTSFDYVKVKVANYPANFALLDRKNVVTFLQELAFQSRCAIWINDRKFYIRFLPENLTAVDTITDSDVDVQSLSVLTTDTERLVTKFIANWRANLNQSQPNQIIYRHNILKYGLITESYDFYIYNQYEPVQKAAEFWLIRKANTWKRIQCKLSPNKLRLESFDPVSFSFAEPLVANGPVTGTVERCVYDSTNDTIELEAWLPVRLGTMEPYVFAFPFDVTNVFPDPDDPNIVTGNPYQDATGQLLPVTPARFVSLQLIPSTKGRGRQIGDQFDVPPGEFITALDPAEINQTRPTGIGAFNNQVKYNVKSFVTPTIANVTANSYYATVISKTGDNEYSCSVYKRGLSNAPQQQNVLIGKLKSDSLLPVGYGLIVHRMVYLGENNETIYEWIAQPPIWTLVDEAP